MRKEKIIALMFSISLIFLLGALTGGWLMHSRAFDAGYQMAYMEIHSLLRTGHAGQRDFSISDMPFRFSPRKDRSAINFNYAGIGDQGYRGRGK